jgi:hypothetical protein
MVQTVFFCRRSVFYIFIMGLIFQPIFFPQINKLAPLCQRCHQITHFTVYSFNVSAAVVDCLLWDLPTWWYQVGLMSSFFIKLVVKCLQHRDATIESNVLSATLLLQRFQLNFLLILSHLFIVFIVRYQKDITSNPTKLISSILLKKRRSFSSHLFSLFL